MDAPDGYILNAHDECSMLRRGPDDHSTSMLETALASVDHAGWAPVREVQPVPYQPVPVGALVPYAPGAKVYRLI